LGKATPPKTIWEEKQLADAKILSQIVENWLENLKNFFGKGERKEVPKK